MSSDLVTQLAGLPLVPQGTLALDFGEASLMQPVANVRDYLEARKPQASFEGEEALLITLPAVLQEETRALYHACKLVKRLVKDGLSVQKSCAEALRVYARQAARFGWHQKNFRTHKFDRWAKARDWTVLVNMAKAPAAWKPESRGLPEPFLEYVARKFAAFKREDGKRQALLAIKRTWQTGRNESGVEEIIPGYEKGWSARNREVHPAGWHYSNILRQIKARAKFGKDIRALLHEGTAAARTFLPQQLSTRKGLRFLEWVTFDDVRTDWLIFDPQGGQPCELWLLVARDTATAMVLGFVLHPSRAREDGSQSHLGLKEMKQLAAWLLERYPLPKDYIVHWVVERGTATLSEGSARALQEMLPHRIQIHFTSMVGGRGATGYEEKRKGNSRGKASHESHNRLFHTQGSFVPGQTGAHYEIRPQDLDARAREAVEVWQMRSRLPAHLRGSEQYPLLTPAQAREHLVRFCVDQNFRDDHAIEGFDEVLEWFDGARWRSQAEYSGAVDVQWRKRLERPVERAAHLIAGHEWEHVSPDIIIAFLRHTERPVLIQPSREIRFRVENRDLVFAPAPNCLAVPGARGLGYHNEDDPAFVHVTDGRGAVLGTWYRRERVGYQDQETLQRAFRYTAGAMAAARARAEALAAPERERLAAMRAHNAELERGNEFIDVARPELETRGAELNAPVAAALDLLAEESHQEAARLRREARAAAESILEVDEQRDSGAGDDLLNALTEEPNQTGETDHEG